MNDFWSIATFVCAVLAGMGGAVAVLEYLGIKPAHDLILRLPRWTLLLLSAVLFSLSVFAFWYSLYLVPHRAWLYLAAVLYAFSLGMLWMLLRHSKRGALQEITDRLASAEKAGALRVLADEADGLISNLRDAYQWMRRNPRVSRPIPEHPLGDLPLNLRGTGSWWEGDERIAGFQDAYRAHRSRIAKHCRDIETPITKQELSELKKLNEEKLGSALTAHGIALRAEGAKLFSS